MILPCYAAMLVVQFFWILQREELLEFAEHLGREKKNVGYFCGITRKKEDKGNGNKKIMHIASYLYYCSRLDTKNIVEGFHKQRYKSLRVDCKPWTTARRLWICWTQWRKASPIHCHLLKREDPRNASPRAAEGASHRQTSAMRRETWSFSTRGEKPRVLRRRNVVCMCVCTIRIPQVDFRANLKIMSELHFWEKKPGVFLSPRTCLVASNWGKRKFTRQKWSCRSAMLSFILLKVTKLYFMVNGRPWAYNPDSQLYPRFWSY